MDNGTILFSSSSAREIVSENLKSTYFKLISLCKLDYLYLLSGYWFSKLMFFCLPIYSINYVDKNIFYVSSKVDGMNSGGPHPILVYFSTIISSFTTKCSYFLTERLHHRPILTEAPQNKTLVVGSSHAFTCKVLSDLHPQVEWFLGHVTNNSDLVNLTKVVVKVLYVSGDTMYAW